MKYNPILATDSYKLSHPKMYPVNVTGMYSYIEPRVKHKTIIPFGLQMWVEKFMETPITLDHIEEAEDFATLHGEPFDRKPWEKIVSVYDGLIPVTIRAVPEGLPVPSGNVLVTIECTDPDLFWLCSHLETSLQRGVWYPTTIASLDYDIKKIIQHCYRISGGDSNLIPFSLHDFGARGVASAEQAEIGGAAHLVNFMGSDNIEGIRAANYYYSEPMAGFSVPATEHSVECSFGGSSAEEETYIRHVLDNYAKPGAIVSIVIDGYDVYRAAETLCTTFKDYIIASGAKVVFRPDSGDMLEVVPRILALQEMAFGSVVNAKGYKKINNVGIIQGDGVNSQSLTKMLSKVLALGYSADNIIFGSGGALLQKVDRDTFKFAQKASAVLRDGVWVGISKSPITDPGKASKSGRLTLIRSRITGEYMTANCDGFDKNEFEDVMQTVYNNGIVSNKTTLKDIRERLDS